MSKTLKEGRTAHYRRFGVEIECGLPGGTDRAHELFYNELRASNPDERWTLTYDGSGVELRTPILKGPSGFEKLRWAMERLKEHGGYVTGADGMHVHHDAPEFVDNPKAVVKLVESWRNNERAIYRMVHHSRRESWGPAPSWHDGAFQNVLDWAAGRRPSLSVARHDLNVASLRAHGSIEIRLHEGTLDPDVAIAWILFGQKFIADVLRRVKPIKASPSDKELMSRIKLSKQAQAMIAAKQAQGHTTPASNRR